jgi:putative ABC transport system permease protein
MDSIARDIRLALRGWRQAPGFTVAAVTMLALAIGAVTAVASVVHAALLRPLPHLDVDRWADLYERPVNEGLGGRLSVSIPNYRDWRDQSRTFAAMILWRPWSITVAGDGQAPERLRAAIVTPNLFRALGLAPAAGRLLQDADDPTRERLILISHGFWERRFGRDPKIVGQTIRLNHVAFTVVGVAPRDFTFPLDGAVDVWLAESPTFIASDTARDARGQQVAGLLRPGATWAEAHAEMDGIAARLAAAHPENRGFGVAIVPMRESLAGDVRRPLLVLFAALAAIVVLVAVNLANLQLVRLDGRRHEFAIRAALGASRARLVRQAAIESALLAVAAGILGLLLAPLVVRALLAFVPEGELAWLRVSGGTMRLVAALSVAVIVALLAGVLPALRAIGANLASGLARGSRGTAATPIGRRLRQVSVVAQLALSLVLLVSAALVVQTFVRLRAVDPGFEAAGRMTLATFAPRARYPDMPRLVTLIERLRLEAGNAPGVRAVGLAQALPFAPGIIWSQAVTRDDPRGVPDLAALPHVHYNVVSAGYAEALGVPVRRGRAFDATDTASSPPVVVINEAFARRFFPGEDPVGRTLWVGHAQALPELPRRTVVGVVGDARWSALDEPASPEAWVPYAQQAGGEEILRALFVIYQASGDPEAAMPGVRARLAQVDPDLPITSTHTLERRLDTAVWRQRLTAAALGALGIAAMLVALVGVLGVTSYLTSQRSHEMGVRLALGARPQAIVRMVLAESGRLVLAGTALGLGGAVAAGRVLSTLLFGVGATDLPTFAVAGAALATAAIAACYLPARRAARVDPLVTLRAESR